MPKAEFELGRGFLQGKGLSWMEVGTRDPVHEEEMKKAKWNIALKEEENNNESV